MHLNASHPRPALAGNKHAHRDQAFEESKHMRKAIAKSEPQDIIAFKRLIHLMEKTIISATQ